MLDSLQQARGICRSLVYYYAAPSRNRRMAAFYARFVKPGDLVFDIGSHVGDRVQCFRRLGCKVVALEPQPSLARILRLIHGRAAGVTVVNAAAGAEGGMLDLHLNLANPTVATASPAFIAAARGAVGWDEERWTRRVSVPMVTLDSLSATHGAPAFIKVDVEGFEEDVLRGLTQAPPALSFEFTTIQRDVALACLRQCRRLGLARFNASFGESHALAHAAWLDETAMAAWVMALPHEANAGDIYATGDLAPA